MSALYCAIMASSLKGYIPALARLVEFTPAALYERQRALVRAGLLAPESGRGPGSGVRTTAESVALVLISALATDSLFEAADRTREISQASPIDSKRCLLTGMANFKDALAAVLVGKALSRKVTEIIVSRTETRALIKFKGGESIFSGAPEHRARVRVEAALDQRTIRNIADDVSAIISGTTDA